MEGCRDDNSDDEEQRSMIQSHQAPNNNGSIGTTNPISSLGSQSKLSPELVNDYLQSSGSDRHLAEAILRDIVQDDLQITFDDIASLSTAKRLLHEAIVLPSMMPEFFTGIRSPWKVSSLATKSSYPFDLTSSF
jgi:hypothetical protein